VDDSSESTSTSPESNGDSQPWVGRRSIFTWIKAHFDTSVGEAISDAGLGVLGGPPRNPNLKPGKGSDFSTVRQAEYAYPRTNVQVDVDLCPVCGLNKLETHTIQNVGVEEDYGVVGSVRMCAECSKESWLFKSHMPSTVAARERDKRIVM
jgi:hypothetical protein